MTLTLHTPMQGKTCLVTGSTSGHGLGLARALARLGADLVLLGRDPEKSSRVADALSQEAPGRRRPAVLLADLSSQGEVARVAQAFAELRPHGRLHLVVNNAGMVSLHRQETSDGLEKVFAVNYLAMFHLTLRLLPRLFAAGSPEAPARVINVASDMHRMARLSLDDLQLRRGYSWHRSYAQSKLAVLLFTRELARQLGEPFPLGRASVVVSAVDPGPVDSGIARSAPPYIARPTAWMMRWFFPSGDRAARTALWAATAPETACVTGRYFRFGRLAEPDLGRDPSLGQRLWQRSVDLTGVDFVGGDLTGGDLTGGDFTGGDLSDWDPHGV